jgi:hypothetical protein
MTTDEKFAWIAGMLDTDGSVHSNRIEFFQSCEGGFPLPLTFIADTLGVSRMAIKPADNLDDDGEQRTLNLDIHAPWDEDAKPLPLHYVGWVAKTVQSKRYVRWIGQRMQWRLAISRVAQETKDLTEQICARSITKVLQFTTPESKSTQSGLELRNESVLCHAGRLCWPYVAGFFAGDGCIGIARSEKKGSHLKQYVLFVVLKQLSCPLVLEKLYDWLAAQGINPVPSSRSNGVMQICSRASVAGFLAGVKPFLGDDTSPKS